MCLQVSVPVEKASDFNHATLHFCWHDWVCIWFKVARAKDLERIALPSFPYHEQDSINSFIILVRPRALRDWDLFKKCED